MILVQYSRTKSFSGLNRIDGAGGNGRRPGHAPNRTAARRAYYSRALGAVRASFFGDFPEPIFGHFPAPIAAIHGHDSRPDSSYRCC